MSSESEEPSGSATERPAQAIITALGTGGHRREPRDHLRGGPSRSCRRFLLKSSATPRPLLLVADLLYALGGVLWTGVVLVVFIQIYPEAQKRRPRRRRISGPARGSRPHWRAIRYRIGRPADPVT
jgi:hypothetical protein